jgi:crenactin
MTSIADSVIEAVEKCPVELQPHLYSQIILSGGNMSWTSPPELRDVAVDAPTRVRFDLVKRGVENLNIRLTEDPQYAVWRGCIVYGYAVPADYSWAWETMEGWMRFKG